MTSDSVAVAGGNPQGVDTSILRIETSYNTQGTIDKITSYSSATGGSAAIVNQIAREYNGLGQLTKEYQEHNGSLNSSLYVAYAYSNPNLGSRLTSMTYPSGKVLSYNYGSANGTNDVISRLDSLSETNGNATTTLEAYTYLGLSTVVKRSHPQDGIDLIYIKLGGESNGDAGDPYTGLDRFGRVVDQRWIDTNANNSAVDRYMYTYDRDGNIVTKENEVAFHAPQVHSDFYEAYTYDGLNRLTATDRYNSSTHDQTWALDALGNMNSVTTNATTENRTYNDENQLTGMGNNTLTFDNNGSVTTDDHGYTLKYDAWNRLVSVKNGGSTLMTYAYDGIGRRISDSDANNTKTDNYYSSSWQNIETRVSVTYGNAGNAATQFVFSPVYVDAVVLRDRDTDANGSLDQRLYATHDITFNCTGLISSGGTVLQRYVYDSYGLFDVKDSSWSGTSDAYAWNRNHQGLEYDPAIGWYMNRNRIYSPTAMRFGQQDPMGCVDGNNYYLALRNNPEITNDPQGLFASIYHYMMTEHSGLLYGVKVKDKIAEKDVGVDLAAFFYPQYHAQEVGWEKLVAHYLRAAASFRCPDQLAEFIDNVAIALHILQDFYSHTDWEDGTDMLRVYKNYNLLFGNMPVAPAGGPSHRGTILPITQILTDVSFENVTYYRGGTVPSVDDLHKRYAVDAPGTGRDAHWVTLANAGGARANLGIRGAFATAYVDAEKQTTAVFEYLEGVLPPSVKGLVFW